MMDQGLAQQSAMAGQQGMQAEAQQAGGQSDQEQIMQLVAQLVELLKQGVTPQQLEEQGVPKELIQMAMEAAGQGQQAPVEEQPVPQGMDGLAALSAR